MRAKTAAAAMLATAVGVLFPTTASANDLTDVIAVPVIVDLGTYRPDNEAILNAVDDRLTNSQTVTPNVDADLALLVKARFASTKSKGRMIIVVYSWAGKTLGRNYYLCSKTEISRCSAAIVSGAEKAAIAVRQSPDWRRLMSNRAP